MTNQGTPKFPTHKECIHFNNGFCILNNVSVDPNQLACPNFTPKNVTSKLQTAGISQQPQPSTQPYPSNHPYTFPSFAGYNSPPTYVDSSSANYRGRYGFRHAPTQLMQGRATFTLMSSGRGGGRGRGGGAGGGGGGGRGGGRGRQGGFAAGPGGECVCPKCGYTAPHQLGVPCFQQTCPKCGTAMTRKG